MRILVTGANGFLGRNTVEHLLRLKKKEDKIKCLVRHKSSTNGLDKLLVKIIRGSLNEKKDIQKAIQKVDTIIHLAATGSGSPVGMFSETVASTERLFDEIKESDVKKVVMISSFSVYEINKTRRGSVITEKTPIESHPEKRDAYAWSKYHQEIIAKNKADELGINLIILRPSVIYGEETNLLCRRIGQQIPGLPFFAVGRSAKVPLIYIRDCAEAVALACINQKINNEIINIVGDNLPTQSQYLKEYQKTFGKIKNNIFVPFPIFYLACWVGEILNKNTRGNFPNVYTRYKAASYKPFEYSNKKAKKLLGWIPKTSVTQGLKKSLMHIKQAGNIK